MIAMLAQKVARDKSSLMEHHLFIIKAWEKRERNFQRYSNMSNRAQFHSQRVVSNAMAQKCFVLILQLESCPGTIKERPRGTSAEAHVSYCGKTESFQCQSTFRGCYEFLGSVRLEFAFNGGASFGSRFPRYRYSSRREGYCLQTTAFY